MIEEPINFISLTIFKRVQYNLHTYNNVCLVLDDDVLNQVCTNSSTGFNNQESDWITWKPDFEGLNSKSQSSQSSVKFDDQNIFKHSILSFNKTRKMAMHR